MVMAVAYADAKLNQIRRETYAGVGGGGVVNTPFLGGSNSADLPHAQLNQLDAGRFADVHYHVNDQFQLVVDGKGRIGRHDLAPYAVHFTRAYTPYGPLVSDADAGLSFFVMRAHGDPGAQYLSAKMDELKRVPDRRPWQISRAVTFPPAASHSAGIDTILNEVPGIKDDRGLAAYALSMKPNAKAWAPDCAQGDGQYLVVVGGSVLRDNREYKALTLVFVGPKESPLYMQSGPQGLKAIVLNFPRPRAGAALGDAIGQTGVDARRWQCTLCSFKYDEVAGLPEEGIAPGTRWADVPDTWSCPDCNSSKIDFKMVEVEK